MAEIKKERIRDRMLKTAARVWELPENEIETNFDPLILLLMDACSAELEKISQEINASQDRLIDRLAEIFVPEAAINGRPAACILQAAATEPVSELNAYHHFYTSQKIAQSITGSTTAKDIFYTPIGSFRLLKAKLEYVCVGSRLYKHHINAPRETIFNGNASNMVNDIWLAISVDKGVQNLEGLSIFFDMRNHSEAHHFYQSLSHCQVEINGNPVRSKQGYWNDAQFELDIESILEKGMDYGKKLNRLEAGIYQRHFICIQDSSPISSLSGNQMPAAFSEGLPAAMVQKLSAEPLIYIRVRPGRMFAQTSIEGINCAINAFPVINRKLNTISYRTDPLMNIIPLPVEEGFLDIESIVSHGGGAYQYRMAASAEEMIEGEAIIRSTGIGKYNSQEVREIIGNLMEAIRDESAFFGNLSNDFIAARLTEISRILARLEDQVVQARDNKLPHYYVLLKPKISGDSVSISYWTTNGQLTKQVKAGSTFSPFNHTFAAPQPCYSLSNNAGGKTSVSNQEKKHILKRQLMSGGKIVSKEDVKLLCLQIFGSALKEVQVHKSVSIGLGAAEGYTRSIEVLITPHQEALQQADELEFMCRELEFQLNEHASLLYPFIIRIHSS
jgi:hypothetical protein